MRKYRFIYLMAFCAFFSCAKESLQEVSVGEQSSNKQIVKSSPQDNNFVYDESTSSWYTYQKDPYSLENFQMAYENIINRQKAGENSNNFLENAPERLSPTHYCLKIIPKNEDEQWEIELMDDIDVLYTPFDYVQLSDESIKDYNIDVNAPNNFFEKNPYIITNSFRTKEGKTITEECQLPILYVVWPVNKPLPTTYEYEIIREAFIPQYNYSNVNQLSRSLNNNMGFSESFLSMLEEEAINLTSPDIKTVAKDFEEVVLPNIYTIYKGYFVNDAGGLEAPLSNLRIRLIKGSRVENLSTNDRGYVEFVSNISPSSNVQCLFHDKSWKIANTRKSAPVSQSLGTLSEVFSKNGMVIGPKKIIAKNKDYPYYQIQRAANFYYYGNHVFGDRYYYKNGIRIVAEKANSNENSNFYYSPISAPHITIYNTSDISLIGTVLHELGHLAHYCLIPNDYLLGTLIEFNKIPNLVCESYASYVGWTVGCAYFSKLGYSEPSKRTGQSRQNWDKTMGSWYSPLFIDLFDDYNQQSSSINEEINHFSHLVIRDIAKNSRTWSSVRNKLKQQIGVYYTEMEFNNYIAPYDYYFR